MNFMYSGNVREKEAKIYTAHILILQEIHMKIVALIVLTFHTNRAVAMVNLDTKLAESKSPWK